MVYICEHCDASFTSRQNLYNHNKRAKYCLEQRGQDRETFICECGKKYTVKKSLRRHQETCVLRKPPDIEQIENIMQRVLGQYEDRLKTLVTNTNTGNPRNVMFGGMEAITDDKLREGADQLSMDFIRKGAKGYADFLKEYPLKDNAICTDRARKKIKYKNEHGEISEDSRLLTQRFFQAISVRNKKLLRDAYEEIRVQVDAIVSENRAGDADITKLLSESINLQDILIRSENAAMGNDEEFTQEFIGHLAKIL